MRSSGGINFWTWKSMTLLDTWTVTSHLLVEGGGHLPGKVGAYWVTKLLQWVWSRAYTLCTITIIFATSTSTCYRSRAASVIVMLFFCRHKPASAYFAQFVGTVCIEFFAVDLISLFVGSCSNQEIKNHENFVQQSSHQHITNHKRPACHHTCESL